MKRWISMLALCAVTIAVSGCATTGEERESDMPWNTPQPWEGSPFIPGMDRY
jgi:hypothetical protein